MAYLYGDSTPFPIDDNFVETLRALTDMCVELLRIDERLEEGDAKVQESRVGLQRDQARMEALAASLVKTLEPHVSDGASPEAQQVAMRVLQSAQQILEGAKASLANRRDQGLRDLASSSGDLRGQVLGALEKFFVEHELPEMIWRLSWKGGIGEGPTTSRAIGATPFNLEVDLEVDAAQSPLWKRATRLDTLERNVTLHLPGEGGWLRRGPRVKETPLDHHFVTEVTVAPDTDRMVLRRSDKHASPGLEIVVRADGQTFPSVQQLAEDGSPVEDVVLLDGADAAAVERVWSKIQGTILDMVKRRVRIVGATLDGERVEDLERPARLAGRVIQSVAVLVSELSRRSPSPRELVLKRDLGNGHRDEVYVTREELVRRYRGLTPLRRNLFEAFQLGQPSEPTEVSRTLEALVDTTEQEGTTPTAVLPPIPAVAARPRP